MVEAATGGPDRIVEARKARDTAKATLDDHLALVSGLRSRVAQVEAEEADAIAKERAKQREQVVRLLVAAGENLVIDPATGEVAHLYSTTLGMRSYYDSAGLGPQVGWTAAPFFFLPFSNVFPFGYWYGTDYAPNTSYVWIFGFSLGNQLLGEKLSTTDRLNA